MKIYDGSKILPGLAVFLGLISFPVWHNLANGKATYRPNPQIPPELVAAQKHCVELGPAMRASHMDLLNQWRDQVVRQNMRVYVSARDGSEHLMSLTQTCMQCHTNKAQFCDQCHNYMGVAPYCWDCHVQP